MRGGIFINLAGGALIVAALFYLAFLKIDSPDFYNLLKDWQTGIGAFLGFLALTLAALIAAYYARERAHDDRQNAITADQDRRNADAKAAQKEHAQEVAALAASLRAELISMRDLFRVRLETCIIGIPKKTSEYHEYVDKVGNANNIQINRIPTWILNDFPEVSRTVFEASAGQIGLLGSDGAYLVVYLYSYEKELKNHYRQALEFADSNGATTSDSRNLLWSFCLFVKRSWEAELILKSLIKDAKT